MLVEEHIHNKDLQSVCVREIQKSLKFSAKKLIEDKIREFGVSYLFDVTLTEIKRVGGVGIIIFQGMQDHTADSIKSLEGFDRAWVEEAQSLSQHSMDLLIPTIRKIGSELWFTWNPKNEDDAVEVLFDNNPKAVVAHVNYIDNPFCPPEMIELAEETKRLSAAKYEHIWLGGFKKYTDEAMFSFELPAYDAVPITIYRHVLRIDTAQKGGKANDHHAYSLIGYTFDEKRAYLLDAGRWSCGFIDLADNIVELVKHIGRNMLPRETFDGIVIEDANVGSALRETLREHKKLNDWGAVNIGLTPKYGNKFARADESAIHLRLGKLLVPSEANRYTNKSSNINQLVSEFTQFTESDTHASDDILDTVLWEVVTNFGSAPRTRWN